MSVAGSRQAQVQTALSAVVDAPRVPFVPTPLPVVEKMLELARVRSSDIVYDLGSGDGRMVIMAAQKFGAEAVGVELDDERFKRSAARIAALRLGQRAKILHGNFFDTDLRRATVVTLYLLSRVNEQLRPLLESQLRPGARVVAHDFPVPGWKPEQVLTRGLGVDSPHALYLYVMGQHKEETMALQDARSYAPSGLGLELDGVIAGFLRSADGGNAFAEVVVEKLGSDLLTKKHIAGVKYEDITINCSLAMSKSFWAWLSATFDRKPLLKNGAVITMDSTWHEVSRLEFYNALVTEIGFPGLDGASKDAAYMTIKITPEYTRWHAVSAASSKAAQPAPGAHKSWLPSNFRLKIDGLDCTRVSKIEALTLKQHVVENPVGEARAYQQEPSYLEVPNLVITTPELHAKDFAAWLEDFVIKGNSAENNEKNGTLEVLAPNLKEVFFSLVFKHLGIFKLSPEKVETGRDAIRRFRAEMYCEEIEFSPPAGAAAGAKYGDSSSSAGKDKAEAQGAAEEDLQTLDKARSDAEWKSLKQAALKELLTEAAFTNKQSPQAAEVARQGPPLRFRT